MQQRRTPWASGRCTTLWTERSARGSPAEALNALTCWPPIQARHLMRVAQRSIVLGETTKSGRAKCPRRSPPTNDLSWTLSPSPQPCDPQRRWQPQSPNLWRSLRRPQWQPRRRLKLASPTSGRSRSRRKRCRLRRRGDADCGFSFATRVAAKACCNVSGRALSRASFRRVCTWGNSCSPRMACRRSAPIEPGEPPSSPSCTLGKL